MDSVAVISIYLSIYLYAYILNVCFMSVSSMMTWTISVLNTISIRTLSDSVGEGEGGMI